MRDASHEPLHAARRRKLAAFCRLLCRYRSLDDATREGVAAMADAAANRSLSTRQRDDYYRDIEDWLYVGSEADPEYPNGHAPTSSESPT